MPQTIEIVARDGVADAYLSTPEDGQIRGGVLFIIDIIGLRERIRLMADRIADEGYAVLVPNVLYRGGPAAAKAIPDLRDNDARAAWVGEMRPLTQALTPSVIAADATAYLDRLGEIAPGPVGISGYCMGGRLGWEIAAAHPDRVAALGGCHTGGVVTEGPDSPHTRASRVTAEVFWGHADHDASMTDEMIETLDRAMDEAGVTHTTEKFSGAAHGYTMSDTAAFDATATERHFEALFGLLGRTVGA
jgi:carboxymethylenebutenolidase